MSLSTWHQRLYVGPPHREHGQRGKRLMTLSPSLLEEEPTVAERFVRSGVEGAFGELYGYPVSLEECELEYDRVLGQSPDR